MKIHSKKKAFKAACKKLAKSGHMNGSDGVFRPRSQASDNSMKRDYSPQEGKKRTIGVL